MPLYILRKAINLFKVLIDSIHEGKKLRAEMYMSAHTKSKKD